MRGLTKQMKAEIEWLRKKLETEELSEKQRKTYEHQIRHKEFVILLEDQCED